MDIIKSVINGICHEVCVAQRLSKFSHHLYASAKWCGLLQCIRYFASNDLSASDLGTLVTQFAAASLISGMLTYVLFLRFILQELETLSEKFQINSSFSYLPVLSCIGFLMSSPALAALTLLSIIRYFSF
jgi:hypothetical protein